jgi:hypothetical protein
MTLSCSQHGGSTAHLAAATPGPAPEPREAASTTVDPPPAPAACAAVDEAKLEPPACKDAIEKTPIPPIVDPNETLARFYEKLVALARGTGKGPVRLAMYGDSNHKGDEMEGHLRRVLQGRFGDAGHGWVPLAMPHWLTHKDVSFGGTWKIWKSAAVSFDPIVRDHNYGLGNTLAETSQSGGLLRIATADAKAPVGQKASRLDLFFLERPDGGVFDVTIDGAAPKRFSTRADAVEAGIQSIAMEDAPHKIEILSRGQGSVRFFGAVLERDVPGIVFDTLACGALNIHQMSWVNPTVREPMAAKRDWDVVMFQLGTTMSQLVFHEPALKKVIAEMREALPNAAIVLLTPPDYLKGQQSDPRIVKVSRQLEEVAQETGVAFWDYRAAMGGDNSMNTFIAKRLVTTDHVHLTTGGHELMGDRLLRALMLDLARFRDKHPDAGCGG